MQSQQAYTVCVCIYVIKINVHRLMCLELCIYRIYEKFHIILVEGLMYGN